MIALKYREGLPTAVGDEFENIASSVQGYLDQEHNEDGSHGTIVPDEVMLDGSVTGRWTSINYDAARFLTGSAAVWTVDESDLNYLRVSRTGQVAIITFGIEQSVLSVANADVLYILLPELKGVPYGKPSQTYQFYVSGAIEWNDVTNGTSGIGVARVLVEPIAGSDRPRTSLFLRRISPTNATFSQWPTTNDLRIWGTVTFQILPDNTAVSYSFT